jgi:hypothetical protein
MKTSARLIALLGVLTGCLLASTSLYAVTVTASSIEALHGNLQAVEPAVLTPLLANSYLSPTSCLGGLGALGAYGPLGMLGPLGEESWNVSKVMGLLPDWTGFSQYLTLNGGPLSEQGPLGPNGPLGHEAYFETLPAINDFAKQLQLGGVWTVLGPLGPLGTLGPLGPLGPIGAHGFQTDSDGNYIDEDLKIQRSVQVGKGSKIHEYDLFEMYSEARAKALKDNDTSFLVLGDTGYEDQFEFTSPERQHITIVVVPEAQLDVFSLKLTTNEEHSEIVDEISSNSSSLINWIQTDVAAGQKIKATVRLKASYHFWPRKGYRLIVVGSGYRFNKTDIRGPHQLP